jgi:hypothetical protein
MELIDSLVFLAFPLSYKNQPRQAQKSKKERARTKQDQVPSSNCCDCESGLVGGVDGGLPAGVDAAAQGWWYGTYIAGLGSLLRGAIGQGTCGGGEAGTGEAHWEEATAKAPERRLGGGGKPGVVT